MPHLKTDNTIELAAACMACGKDVKLKEQSKTRFSVLGPVTVSVINMNFYIRWLDIFGNAAITARGTNINLRVSIQDLEL